MNIFQAHSETPQPDHLVELGTGTRPKRERSVSKDGIDAIYIQYIHIIYVFSSYFEVSHFYIYR